MFIRRGCKVRLPSDPIVLRKDEILKVASDWYLVELMLYIWRLVKPKWMRREVQGQCMISKPQNSRVNNNQGHAGGYEAVQPA